MAGAPLVAVAENPGHRDTRMVERHYGHSSASYVPDIIRKSASTFDIVDTSNVVAVSDALP